MGLNILNNFTGLAVCFTTQTKKVGCVPMIPKHVGERCYLLPLCGYSHTGLLNGEDLLSENSVLS